MSQIWSNPIRPSDRTFELWFKTKGLFEPLFWPPTGPFWALSGAVRRHSRILGGLGHQRHRHGPLRVPGAVRRWVGICPAFSHIKAEAFFRLFSVDGVDFMYTFFIIITECQIISPATKKQKNLFLTAIPQSKNKNHQLQKSTAWLYRGLLP